jgi:predicted metal-binding membrane protein
MAWLALILWERSPYGRYLDHGDWVRLGIAADLCRALPAGGVLLPALFYSAGWLAMTAAMMLPTTLPLLDVFRRLTRSRPDRGLLLALLVTGYLAAWGGFGVVAHLVSLLLLGLVRLSPWPAFNGWAIGASVLALASVFQFSALKYRCLEACRTPLGFVAARWHGVWPRVEALRLGIAHGLYCVGCCWALMLVMFAVGTGSIGWMLLLGLAMAAEKNLPLARRLGRPLGAALLGWALLLIARELAL